MLRTLIHRLFSGGAAAGPTDPYFDQTTLLLHGDGTNGAQNNTFLDSSTNNFTITRNGNTTQGTFSPFSQDDGKWGNYFDGSGDYLTVADNAALDLGTGNFTIEAWIFATSVSPTANFTIVAKGASSATGTWQFDITSSSKLRIQYDSAGEIISTASLVANTWNHVAVVREGTGSNQTKLYINGTNDGTGTVSSNLGDASTVKIGLNRDGTTYFQGYISNLRIVKGTAVYTSNFTPSSTPLTAISGTSLLTCQSNRFKDNSANAFAITVNGNTSIQPFSPFAPSAAYSAATNGGSGYFDGSGDYLYLSDNDITNYGSSPFCLEAWVYATSSVSTNYVFSQHTTGNKGPLIGVGSVTTGRMGVIYSKSGSDNYTLDATSAFQINEWTHVVFCRTSNTISLFINGSRVATTTETGSLYNSTATIGIGTHIQSLGSAVWPGYITGLRSVKGSNPYDATQTTLTVPTAPPTAITNTSLLLNFTNAGILDNTGRNDLETVGNAQISTSVKKFGTGSLAFDGTGDYLSIPYNQNFNFGTGDFTVECWANISYVQYSAIITSTPVSIVSGNWLLGYSNTANQMAFAIDSGGAAIVGADYTSYANTWTHIAVSRSGTTLRMFFNGVQVASVTNSTNFVGAPTTPVVMGRRYTDNAAYNLNGYIDDLRITKGVARYTSNFTPPTAAFEDK